MSLLKPDNTKLILSASLNTQTQIAVSACLLGHQVRYDAKVLSKWDQNPLLKQLNLQPEQVELIPFCPEVGIGLGVPRAKIQVIRNKQQQIRVIGVADHTLDVTEQLESYAEEFLQHYPDINIVVVKSKSPSCGYQSTPLFDGERIDSQQKQIAMSSGLFVQTILKIKPQLMIIDI